MHVAHLSVVDFRSYEQAQVPLGPGPTTLLGSNGQGKTNLVEAVGYLATLSSHRVAQDAPLVRMGAERALLGAAIEQHGRRTLAELEILPGRANKARLNRSPLPRPRELLGTLRAVLFAPEDLALVKGDPSERRRFLDELLVARQPRWAGVRADYDRIVRQRNALLKSAAPQLRGERRGARRGVRAPDPAGFGEEEALAAHTLEVWNDQLATVGAQLLYARLRLLRDLRPFLTEAYEVVSDESAQAGAVYRTSLGEDAAERIAAGEVPEHEELHAQLHAAIASRRREELERGVTLVGPHRDEVLLSLGELPARGYASHGESWSLALGLRLAAFQLLRRDLRQDPVLMLDDVFAELDEGRRGRLASLIADAEQVVITAAVHDDVPSTLAGQTLRVADGRVGPEGGSDA